jgi:hypothetical protein
MVRRAAIILSQLASQEISGTDCQACGDELNQLTIVQGELDKERRVVVEIK